MTFHTPRGIVRAYANASNPNAILAELSQAFASFKAHQAEEVAEVRAAVDKLFAQQASLGINGNAGAAGMLGNMRHEAEALADFSRSGAVRADLSIGGTGAGDLSKGGAAVFPAISNQIMVRTFAQSAIARLARRVTIEAGSSFQEPQDLGEPAAGWVTETDARPVTDSADFALLDVPLHEVYSLQKITQRLLDDSQFNLGAWLADRIADKLARISGAAYFVGDGVNKPTGLATAPVSKLADATRPWGTVQAIYTGAAGAIGTAFPEKLVDAIYSLQAQYRPGAVWLMNSRTAGVVRKLKDADGRFLWADSLAAGQPPLLLGHPVEIDENAPDIATNSRSIYFGDIAQAYLTVTRPGLRLLRDPFTVKGSVLFYAYARAGGALQNSDALKAIVFGVEPA
jgi:HK97 family phage major capsid protein